jgi:hypothetical protein
MGQHAGDNMKEMRFKISGHVKVIDKDKCGNVLRVVEQHNMIVDGFLDTILGDALVTTGATNLIYRMSWGSGGHSGSERIMPSDAWHTYTTLVNPYGSQDLDATFPTKNNDAITHMLKLSAQCEFAANDYGLAGDTVSEIGLIVGTGTAGVLLAGAPGSELGPNDTMIAYNTIDPVVMNVGDTRTVSWVIGIRKEVF